MCIRLFRLHINFDYPLFSTQQNDFPSFTFYSLFAFKKRKVCDAWNWMHKTRNKSAKFGKSHLLLSLFRLSNFKNPFVVCKIYSFHYNLTILFRPDGDWRRCGTLASLRASCQPDVIECIWIESSKDICFGVWNAPVEKMDK